MNVAAIAVFAMGLRHGADPDHLAVIDNLTRNATTRMPRTSRFTGTLFAVGHAGMVMLMTTAAAFLGATIGKVSSSFERVGAYASVVTLLIMVGFNVYSLIQGKRANTISRGLPTYLKNASHPLVAIPIGALFGLGFETSSQLLAYSTAFATAQGSSGLIIGALFCVGMILTDTFDSLFVVRIMNQPAAQIFDARRPWILAVTMIALVVVVEEIYELRYGFPLIDETQLSIATIIVLFLTAGLIFVQQRSNPVREKSS